MSIAEFSNWLRRVIWGRFGWGRFGVGPFWPGTHCVHHYPSINCLFSVFSNINGEHESTLTTSKKYSWCIPVQKEIKPIIWGAAVTPELWNCQQCLFIFEDPNVRVARLLESLATITWMLRSQPCIMPDLGVPGSGRGSLGWWVSNCNVPQTTYVNRGPHHISINQTMAHFKNPIGDSQKWCM